MKGSNHAFFETIYLIVLVAFSLASSPTLSGYKVRSQLGASTQNSENANFEENSVLQVRKESSKRWVCSQTYQFTKKANFVLPLKIGSPEAVCLEAQVTVEASFEIAKKQHAVQL